MGAFQKSTFNVGAMICLVECWRNFFKRKKIAEETISTCMETNPISNLDKILKGGSYPPHKHLCKFW